MRSMARGAVDHRIISRHDRAIDYQGGAMRQAVALEPIPAAQAVGRYAEIVGYGGHSVPTPHFIACGFTRIGHSARVNRAPGGDRDDQLAVGLEIPALQIIYFFD